MSKYNIQNLKSYPRIADEPTAPRPVSVRLPLSHHEAWMSLPTEVRNDFLRKAIADFLVEQKLLEV